MEFSLKEKQKIQRQFLKIDLISKHLYCTICQEVFDDPKRITCGHTYCNDCILNWKKKQSTCPVCRVGFTANQISKDLIAFNLINDLDVICKNKSIEIISNNLIGCVWKGTLGELDQHLKFCLMDETRLEEFMKKEKEIESKVLREDPSFIKSIETNEKNFLRSKEILAQKLASNLQAFSQKLIDSTDNNLNVASNKCVVNHKIKPDEINNFIKFNNKKNDCTDSIVSNKQHSNVFETTPFAFNNNLNQQNFTYVSVSPFEPINFPLNRPCANLGSPFEEFLKLNPLIKINDFVNNKYFQCGCQTCSKLIQNEFVKYAHDKIEDISLKNKKVPAFDEAEEKEIQLAIKLSKKSFEEEENKRKKPNEEVKNNQEEIKNAKEKPARKKRSLPASKKDEITNPVKDKKFKKK